MARVYLARMMYRRLAGLVMRPAEIAGETHRGSKKLLAQGEHRGMKSPCMHWYCSGNKVGCSHVVAADTCHEVLQSAWWQSEPQPVSHHLLPAEYMCAEGKWPSRGTKIAGVGASRWLWQLRYTVQQGTAAPARVNSLVGLASILNNAVLAYTWTMDTTWDRSAALASGDAAGAAVDTLLSSPSAVTDQQFEASVAQVCIA